MRQAMDEAFDNLDKPPMDKSMDKMGGADQECMAIAKQIEDYADKYDMSVDDAVEKVKGMAMKEEEDEPEEPGEDDMSGGDDKKALIVAMLKKKNG